MTTNKSRIAVLICACAVPPAYAADFDGSKPLICASVQAMDCTASHGCVTGTPFEIGAPTFMRLDFAKKTVSGPNRTTVIQSMENDQQQTVLRGSELGFAWTMAIDRTDGRMVASLTDVNGVFAVFGSCALL